jgi:hypothetical protein
MTRNRWLAVGAAVVLAAGLAVGLSLAFTGGGGNGAPKQPTHDQWEAMWDATHVGDAQQSTLARWPKVPYQHFTDNLKDDCYEWAEQPKPPYTSMPAHLFDLCFKDGVLRSKELS